MPLIKLYLKNKFRIKDNEKSCDREIVAFFHQVTNRPALNKQGDFIWCLLALFLLGNAFLVYNMLIIELSIR